MQTRMNPSPAARAPVLRLVPEVRQQRPMLMLHRAGTGHSAPASAASPVCPDEAMLSAALDYCAAVLAQCAGIVRLSTTDQAGNPRMAAAASAAAAVLVQIGQARAQLPMFVHWLKAFRTDAPVGFVSGTPAAIESPSALEAIHRALSIYLDALQGCAEIQLASEFGVMILLQGDDTVARLAREFDPRFAAAAALRSRIEAAMSSLPQPA